MSEVEMTNGTTTRDRDAAKRTAKKPAASVVEEEGISPVVIMPLTRQTIEIKIEGISPLLICNFAQKTITEMEAAQTKGKGAVKGKKPPKVIEDCYNGARYLAAADAMQEGGWDGVNAVSFRAAMISACRLVDGLNMTNAKQMIFVEPDGYDENMTPLVRIIGEPKMHRGTVRVGPQKTADLRYRPMYWPWAAMIRITHNPAWISAESLANLLAIAGEACGVGEWRPTAPKCFTGTMGRWKLA